MPDWTSPVRVFRDNGSGKLAVKEDLGPQGGVGVIRAGDSLPQGTLRDEVQGFLDQREKDTKRKAAEAAEAAEIEKQKRAEKDAAKTERKAAKKDASEKREDKDASGSRTKK